MLDSSYQLTDEEVKFIRSEGLPDPVALGWLKAKRHAEGKPLQPGGFADFFGLVGDTMENPLFDLFKQPRDK